MRCSRIALAAATLSVAWCGQAWADDASEKALEKKLVEMQKQIDDMSKKLSDGSNRSEDELEERIGQLEKVTKKDQDGLFAYYKNGPRLDSVDGAFKCQFFGRIQDDWTFWDRKEEVTAALGETNNSVEFRRVRLGMGGTMYKNVVYKAEVNFAGAGTAVFKDVFMEFKDLVPGILTFRAGHFDEPQGLDGLTSSKYTTFTERSLLESFRPERSNGFMVYGGALDNRLAWFAGFFRDTDNFGNRVSPDLQGEHDITLRVTGRPYVNEDGTAYVHLGISMMDRRPNNDTVQFRSRPEVHVGPQFVDTGAIADVDRNRQWGFEGAGVFGPFHVQAEWMIADLTAHENSSQDDMTFDAKSIQASWFITGENREYEAAGGRFDRIKVKKNWGSNGFGALELALRWSNLDLNDGPVTGGELTDWTFGINWYLNPNTRVMFDIIKAKKKELESITAAVMSFRIDF